MNFAFGVVCKVPNLFVKFKNSPTPRDFTFRLGKPKVGGAGGRSPTWKTEIVDAKW